MKTKYRFMGLIGSLVCLGTGGNAYADPESMPDELLENLPAIELELPDILPGFGSEYTMKFVSPSPGVDCKILRISPDPGIDYKIKITGPRLQLFPVDIDTRKEELPMGKK